MGIRQNGHKNSRISPSQYISIHTAIVCNSNPARKKGCCQPCTVGPMLIHICFNEYALEVELRCPRLLFVCIFTMKMNRLSFDWIHPTGVDPGYTNHLSYPNQMNSTLNGRPIWLPLAKAKGSYQPPKPNIWNLPWNPSQILGPDRFQDLVHLLPSLCQISQDICQDTHEPW